MQPCLPEASASSPEPAARDSAWPSPGHTGPFILQHRLESDHVHTRDCPQQILVLDITPLDTAWAHIQEHASPQPLNASNASWACATRGVDVRSGKSRCCTSECHITKVAEHAIRALKGEVRSVFAPQLTFSRPQSLRNREFLTMHATESYMGNTRG